jgi:hypothetical protein
MAAAAPSVDAAHVLAALPDAASWATPHELELAAQLLRDGQDHIFKAWRVGADVEKKHAFFAQVRGRVRLRRGRGRGHASGSAHARSRRSTR